MNDNELQPSQRSLLRRRLTWVLCALVVVLGLLAIYPGWRWLSERGVPEEPARTPELLAGDRQRMEAFLAAHDYEAFLRLMELQPRAVRSEVPPEWLRRYEEIKPALLFTVREVSTEDVINSEEKYEAPLLSLRWSKDGKYLADVLEKEWNPKAREKPSKLFDGRTGRLVLMPEDPPLVPETEANWPLGKWNKPKSANDELLNWLCFSFGQDPAYWHAQKLYHVLLMPSPDNYLILTGFAVNPKDVETWKKGHTVDATGEPMWTIREHWEGKVSASRRCFNVWKADAFPQ